MMATDIMLASGLKFDFMDPERCEFGIVDIAHALAQICRFTGHTRRFYSVAQHSVLVSFAVPPEDALAGLLHDAAEAFLGDVAKPLKNLLPDYQELERRIEAVVFARFGLPPVLPPSVKRADLVMLATEKRDLMHNDGQTWQSLGDVQPLAMRMAPEPPVTARASFLKRFHDLERRLP